MSERKRTALDIAKEKVTELVLKELEKGTAIWTCPWVMQSAHHGFRGKAYSGASACDYHLSFRIFRKIFFCELLRQRKKGVTALYALCLCSAVHAESSQN